jgi:hypothetical protein
MTRKQPGGAIMSQLLDDYQHQRQQQEARLPTYKGAVLKLLRRAGAAEAIIEYDGEGDDGQIVAVTLHDARGKELPDKPLPVPAKRTFAELHLSQDSLEGALEAFAWELLSIHHEGFENNEGAYGTITVDVKQQIVAIEHNARVIELVTTTDEV